MHSMQPGETPQPGDVIIHRIGDQKFQYAVGTTEHRDQLVFPTRRGALAHSVGYAAARDVRIWHVDDRDRFKLVRNASDELAFQRIF